MLTSETVLMCSPCKLITETIYEWSHRWEEGVGDDFQAWAHDHRDDPTHMADARAYMKRAGIEIEEPANV